MPGILVVDDEPLQRNILKTILEDNGYETFVASSGEEAIDISKKFNPDLILTDLKLGEMDGVQVLNEVKNGAISPAVIIMTAFGTVASAVEAMKKGAFDYLTKPLDKDVLLLTVKRALERMDLIKENKQLHQALYEKFSIEGIIGNSSKMKEALNIAKKISTSHATVLILGESGTGKELMAHAIHYNSTRRAKPFTAINCAAIPENLLESELFGYEAGAFTGAASRRTGLFEASTGGTLFLDEIGDMPLITQSKILRALQEKEIRRLGGKESIKVDVRIITATNKDIEQEIKKGNFREDLYYRLKVVRIELPALRNRKEDILELANYFINKYNNEFGKRIKGIDNSAIKALIDYHWPGNIRQLESVIETAVLMCDSSLITMKDVKNELRLSEHAGTFDMDIPEEGINFEELERKLLKKAMIKSNNVAAKAARLLGMSYKTFWYRWEKFGLNTSLKEDILP
ncbi:MAG: sigma-54 dependent transcriptional regulator [Nitrospiraceae bacterium]|nr:sigma-54 dependent transcriptional regulator [Nitrospiraceae bacterium]